MSVRPPNARKPWFRTSGKYAVLKKDQFRPEDFSYRLVAGTQTFRNIEVVFRRKTPVKSGSFAVELDTNRVAQVTSFFPFGRQTDAFKYFALRDRGIGRLVLAELERQAKEMGAKEIVTPPFGSEAFWSKMGYERKNGSIMMHKRLS